MVCASSPAPCRGGPARSREISRRLPAVAPPEVGHFIPGKLPSCLLWKRLLPATTQLVAPLFNHKHCEQEKTVAQPRGPELICAYSYLQTTELLLSTCSTMDRRTYEGPMDWEYQSQPPVDHSSPFAKFSQKQPACKSRSVLSPLLPVAVQPSAAQFSLSPPTFPRTAHHGEH